MRAGVCILQCLLGITKGLGLVIQALLSLLPVLLQTVAPCGTVSKQKLLQILQLP